LYQAPRGTVDILPREQAYWRFVELKAAEACRLYGYERIDTPVFEDAGLFNRSVGEGTDIIDKEMYLFKDRGGNELALKPEGTASVCRAYVEHGMQNLPQPVKLYYLMSMFRYDRPQAGRYRQHLQFGCEAIGSDDPALDAEVIDTAWQFYLSMDISQLFLSLNSIGCKECRPKYLAALKEHYTGASEKLCPDCKTRLIKNPMRLLDCKKDTCQPVADSAPKSVDYLCQPCAEHFSQLKKYLDILNIPFGINHRLVRGLSYYSRTVFEIQPTSGGSQSSLGGGGRYDGLIEEIGGKPTPGVGFAAGIDRIILQLKDQKIVIPQLARPQVFIAYLGDEAKEAAIKAAAALRRLGIGVIESFGERSLKAQLRQANNMGIPRAIIIGEEEVKSGTVILRDMTNASQQTVPFLQLPELLK
jgi:histidyl-tRNA synthetase